MSPLPANSGASAGGQARDERTAFVRLSLLVKGMHEAPAPGHGVNVIPLARWTRAAPADPAREFPLRPEDRPTSPLANARSIGRLTGILICSLVLHAGVFIAATREVEPIASIGEEAITVEIVVGANAAAGVSDQAANQEVENRSAADMKPRETDKETPRDELQREPETKAVSNEPEPKEPPVEPAPQDVAKLVSPDEPIAPMVREPQPPKHETRPPEAKPVERPQPQSQSSPSPPASAANSIGRGRLAGDANYHGRVAAHLARYKRFPADARSRRQQGSAVVSFNIDGAGRVTSVRLVRGTGFTPLDHEVEAMVHRASPFPSPPSGTAMSFTAPVSFRLN